MYIYAGASTCSGFFLCYRTYRAPYVGIASYLSYAYSNRIFLLCIYVNRISAIIVIVKANVLKPHARGLILWIMLGAAMRKHKIILLTFEQEL